VDEFYPLNYKGKEDDYNFFLGLKVLSLTNIFFFFSRISGEQSEESFLMGGLVSTNQSATKHARDVTERDWTTPAIFNKNVL